jgi:NAD(P)-dependent dehydrogenase (short-subunit alcohol dehydrogenase family)
MFNVRVAIVEPGIIDTRMARGLEEPAGGSPDPQQRRLALMFVAALKNPVPPSLVADKILDIVESGTWQLRHPVGPDAGAFLKWRESMTDEEWVAFHSADDETWYRRMERDFGLTIPRN